LIPLGQGGGAVLFEDFASVEVAFLIEMVLDRGKGGRKLLQGLNIPKICLGEHRTKPVAPEPNSFVADIDAPLEQKVFNLAQRQLIAACTSSPRGGSPRVGC
jgi:hypothetical protein